MRIELLMIDETKMEFKDVDEVSHNISPDRVILWQYNWKVKVVIPIDSFILYREYRED
jgi:hypothetical protein